jgi:hypothetical protein
MSEREGAGSEEIRSVFWPDRAKWMARAAEMVVLPTPPLPPTMMSLLPAKSESRIKNKGFTAESAEDAEKNKMQIPKKDQTFLNFVLHDWTQRSLRALR